MPFAFGGVSTLAFDGAIQWTNRTATEHNGDPDEVVGLKLWNWSTNADPIRRALADAMFDGKPQAFVAGWMPPAGGPMLRTKAAVYPLPRGRMHDVVLLWAEAHAGSPLTRVEHRTLKAYADGMHQREIARHFGVSLQAVKTALARVREKLGARHIGNAISLAKERGLI